jgi:malate dehydrogenase
MAVAFPQSLPVLTVAITGAAGQIGYALAPLVASGQTFGSSQRVALRLLDMPAVLSVLTAVQMELDDGAYPLLDSVTICTVQDEAFIDADVAIFCGAFPRKQGMERKDLLLINAGIFRAQGEILKRTAKPHCRVLVVGNPANTNALILAAAQNADGLDPRQITALTRLDHNRATTMARKKCGGAAVRNVIIWGNHSGTQVPDVNAAVLEATSQPVRDAAKSADYFDGPFLSEVQQRGAEVIKMRGMSSAMSAARAISDHMHDWILGTAPGVRVSMAVWSTGNAYGVPENLVFSFPVTCNAGDWKIADGIAWSPLVAEKMKATIAELEEEKTIALNPPTPVVP